MTILNRSPYTRGLNSGQKRTSSKCLSDLRRSVSMAVGGIWWLLPLVQEKLWWRRSTTNVERVKRVARQGCFSLRIAFKFCDRHSPPFAKYCVILHLVNYLMAKTRL